jgi:hypothetical protein
MGTFPNTRSSNACGVRLRYLCRSCARDQSKNAAESMNLSDIVPSPVRIPVRQMVRKLREATRIYAQKIFGYSAAPSMGPSLVSQSNLGVNCGRAGGLPTAAVGIGGQAS